MDKLVRVRSAIPKEGFCVLVEFTDGTKREINLEPFLRGPVFESLRQNLQAFRSFRVDPKAGTIIWDNGADIDPDVLYKGLRPAWMESNQLATH